MDAYDIEFVECPSCAAKRGSPNLCEPCYSNRASINALKDRLGREQRTREAVEAMTDGLLKAYVEGAKR